MYKLPHVSKLPHASSTQIFACLDCYENCEKERKNRKKI